MHRLRRFKASGLVLVCVAGTTFLSSNPAHAAVNCLTGISSIQDLITNGSCDLKGVILTYTSSSGFANSAFITITATPPGVTPTPTATAFTISFQGNPTPYTSPFTGEFKYTLAAPSGKYIVDYTSALSSAENGGNNTGTFNLTGAAGTAAATYVPVNTAVGQTKTYSNTTTVSDAFTAGVGVTQGTITQFTQSFNFADTPPPTTSVPGPLPLVGAGIAFGYSRKLRKRITAV
jgi:hypothetical protein